MKEQIKVAAVQFEMAQNDKKTNLSTMARMVEEAAAKGVEVLCFPELCTTGYHFLTSLTGDALLDIAESADAGPTVDFIHQLAKQHQVTILFGMLERSESDRMYNTCVVVTSDGPIFKHRKVHAFENTAICQGDRLDTFDLHGWCCGILICYDLNLPENPRVLSLNGAEIIFAPHQTGGFDIDRAGMGRIPLEYWQSRHEDPIPMRQAILGPQGREWLIKWLPSRSYDNSVYTIFSNGVGIDGVEVRTGGSMIIDPEGIVIAETTEAEDSMAVAVLSKSALKDTLGASHILSRRPSLYEKICAPIEEKSTRDIRNRISGETIR